MAPTATPTGPDLAQLALARGVLQVGAMKRTIAIVAGIGLLGCFMPLATWRGNTISLVTLRHLDWLGVMLILLGFATPLLALLVAPSPRTTAIASLAGFGYVMWKLGLSSINLIINGSLGGRMIGAAAIAGVVVSLIGVLDSPSARLNRSGVLDPQQ